MVGYAVTPEERARIVQYLRSNPSASQARVGRVFGRSDIIIGRIIKEDKIARHKPKPVPNPAHLRQEWGYLRCEHAREAVLARLRFEDAEIPASDGKRLPWV